jgi:hypothetical protein
MGSVEGLAEAEGLSVEVGKMLSALIASVQAKS